MLIYIHIYIYIDSYIFLRIHLYVRTYFFIHDLEMRGWSNWDYAISHLRAAPVLEAGAWKLHEV